MSDAAAVRKPMTVAEFLEWDSGDDLVWELIDGFPRLKFPPNPELRGQAAPSDEHAVIVKNVTYAVETAIRAQGRPCRVMPGPGQAIPRRGDRHRIPDLAVKCGRSAFEARDPILIVEVVSPSNRAVELVERQADFQSLPTVQEVVIIEQARPVVMRHRRVGDLWRTDRFEGLDAALTLESVDLVLPLSEIYFSVLRPEAEPGPKSQDNPLS